MNTSTLLGGRSATARFNDGSTLAVLIRQLTLRDYAPAFALAHDEIALTSFICTPAPAAPGAVKLPSQAKDYFDRQPEAGLDLAPDSYEELLTAAREVNEKGFFAFCRRRMEAAQQRELELSAAVAALPAEVRTVLLNEGAKALASASGNNSSSPRPPRPR